MSEYKFEDIEVGDIVTLRIPIKFQRATEVTGVVEWVSHPSFDRGIRIHGFVDPLYEGSVSLRNLEKKPIELPEVGRPIKIWVAQIPGSTCYGVWDGVSFTGVSCEHGPTETRAWPIYEISDSVARAIRWEYLDT